MQPNLLTYLLTCSCDWLKGPPGSGNLSACMYDNRNGGSPITYAETTSTILNITVRQYYCLVAYLHRLYSVWHLRLLYSLHRTHAHETRTKCCASQILTHVYASSGTKLREV